MLMKQKNCIPRLELNARCKTAFAKFGMSDKAISAHLVRMRCLHHFMENRGYDSYDRDVGEAYCLFLREEGSYTYNYQKSHFDYITLLNLVVDNLPYSARFRYRSDYTQPDTALGRIANAFFEKMERERYGYVSINQYKLHLKKFSLAMESRGKEPETIDRYDVLDFMSSSDVAFVRRLSILRHFLFYLFEQGYTKTDLSKVLIGSKPPVKEKVLSYYTPDEIRRIENAVNRASSTGKRDYAMILLATRLGLRSSDIRHMQLKDIDWDKSIIRIQQFKTKRYIELPLLADVGDAIIDYILNARPKTEYSNVFITANHPFKDIGDSAFTGVVIRVMKKSRVNVDGRHHGTHCLRHSLATAMMNNGTELPVISEVLGHVSTESTMYYLGVNLSNLLFCSHSVPMVPDAYYTQKGGVFYE